MTTPVRSRTWRRAIAVGAVALVAAMVSPSVGAATKKPVRKSSKKAVKRAPANFALGFLGDERTVSAGSAASYTFTLSTAGRFRGGVVFDVPDLPPGITAKVTATTSNSFKMDISTTSSALGGSAVYALRGISGNLTRTAIFRLTVVAAPTTTVAGTPTTVVTGDFVVTTDTPTLTLSPTETGAMSVNIARRGGFVAPVTFKLEGLPANVDAAFAPNPTQANAKLYIAPGAAAPSGTYLLVITASAGTITSSVAARLVIRRVGAFTMTLAPATLSTPQGIDASTTVTVSPPTGQTLVPDVSILISAAPPGVTVLTPVTTGRSTKITLSTRSTTAPGVYNFNVVGRSGTNSQTVALQLTVTANTPGFGLSAQPATQAVARGSVATYTITAASTGGFNGAIAYSVAGLPNTATAVIELTATGATVKITTTAATAPTTYPLQFIGKSGTLTSTVPVDMVVTAPAS